MLDETMIQMLLEGIRDTCYMTIVSTFFGYVVGLPLGIALTLTDAGGIAPNRTVYRILDVIINITRSIPFLILLILGILAFVIIRSMMSGKEVQKEEELYLIPYLLMKRDLQLIMVNMFVF